MIHARITRNPSTEQIDGIHISITEDSLPNFQQLIHRALNTWDSAPKELKELGDMLVHGYVTQDHTYTPINTKQNTDYYNAAEQQIIAQYIEQRGIENWELHLREGTTHKVLKGEG
jgi:homoaconitase/3-isopropylmalate dehydratase large subunit